MIFSCPRSFLKFSNLTKLLALQKWLHLDTLLPIHTQPVSTNHHTIIACTRMVIFCIYIFVQRYITGTYGRTMYIAYNFCRNHLRYGCAIIPTLHYLKIPFIWGLIFVKLGHKKELGPCISRIWGPLGQMRSIMSKNMVDGHIVCPQVWGK